MNLRQYLRQYKLQKSVTSKLPTLLLLVFYFFPYVQHTATKAHMIAVPVAIPNAICIIHLLTALSYYHRLEWLSYIKI